MYQRIRAKTLLITSLLALAIQAPARAGGVLDLAEKVFFNPADRTRVGIEIEYGGLSAKASAELTARVFGGTVEPHDTTLSTTVASINPDGTKVYNEVKATEYWVKTPRLGEIIYKPDLNQVTEYGEIDASKAVTELVTEPIRFPEVSRDLSKLGHALARAGAKPTHPDLAVATQVNMEIAEGKRDKIRIREVVNLLRNYLAPAHRGEIEEQLAVPPIRKPYLSSYSPGMMKKLTDPAYAPTEREFYDDFIYRQSLEFLGEKEAWTMPIAEARALLLSKPDRLVPIVVKLNPLRVSSLLMFMFPEDPMSEYYEKSGWAKARPLLEFREWNTTPDLDAVHPVKQALGLAAKARAETRGMVMRCFRSRLE